MLHYFMPKLLAASPSTTTYPSFDLVTNLLPKYHNSASASRPNPNWTCCRVKRREVHSYSDMIVFVCDGIMMKNLFGY